MSGFFGPVTATLDWCEANYQFSHYVAEMVNTVSNLFTIYLAIHGTFHALQEKLPLRYIIGFMGIAMVGAGSLAFHATLLYEAQLADELPMIYVATMSLWLLFDRRPGYSFDSRRSRYQLVILVLFNAFFTYSYYLYRNPVYHQVVFACLAIGSGIRITYILKWSDSRTLVPAKQRGQIGKLFGVGAALFVFGFLIWNLDNIFCDTITRWKVRLGWPAAFLLEGHAWWHILTGLGSSYMTIGVEYVTLCIKDDYRNFTIQRSYELYYMKRLNNDIDKTQ